MSRRSQELVVRRTNDDIFEQTFRVVLSQASKRVPNSSPWKPAIHKARAPVVPRSQSAAENDLQRHADQLQASTSVHHPSTEPTRGRYTSHMTATRGHRLNGNSAWPHNESVGRRGDPSEMPWEYASPVTSPMLKKARSKTVAGRARSDAYKRSKKVLAQTTSYQCPAE